MSEDHGPAAGCNFQKCGIPDSPVPCPFVKDAQPPTTDEEPRREKSGLTTRDLFALDHACSFLNKAFPATYLVGTAYTSGRYRDVDVRTMLDDKDFDRIFADSGVWEVFCFTVGCWLSAQTGLPVDYQVQRVSEANAKYGGKPRNPLGIGARDYAGLGDATNYKTY